MYISGKSERVRSKKWNIIPEMHVELNSTSIAKSKPSNGLQFQHAKLVDSTHSSIMHTIWNNMSFITHHGSR